MSADMCCLAEVFSAFHSAFGGYIGGLAATIVVMNISEAAQPALLYIVPAVLGAVGLHACARGQFKQVGSLACFKAIFT